MFLHVTSVLATLKQRVKRRTAGPDRDPADARKTGKADGKSESSKKQR